MSTTTVDTPAMRGRRTGSRLDAALAKLRAAIDAGGEFPDEVIRAARFYLVPVEALTRAYDRNPE